MTSVLDMFFSVSEVSGDLCVHVQPQYDPARSRPLHDQYVWQYHIRIENRGHETVQLIKRHWIVTDANGRVQEVRGDGVVGEQPVLEPAASFDYVSGCPLSTPSGLMQGSFGMRGEDGREFWIAVPAFDLLSPHSRRLAN